MPRDMLTLEYEAEVPDLDGLDGTGAPPPWAPSTVQAGERHFLLICGPFGAFTRVLGRDLRAAGARCSRVILNGGDAFDWGVTDAPAYFGPMGGFAPWVSTLIGREAVTDVIVYGDAHPYCAAAVQVAYDKGLKVHVLEQGYFRPFWITLENGGVNGNSRLPRDPAVYRREARCAPSPQETWLPPLTPPAVRNLALYHLVLWLTTPLFPRFHLPYVYSLPRQTIGHIRRFADLRLFRARHRRRLAHALDTPDPVFVGILQRPGDSQLRFHSPFPTSADFIDRVTQSFARHAPPAARLLFKSHPLDHGIEAHGRSVAASAAAHGVAGRVFFTDVGDLQLMLPRIAGAVTANSTAGLSVIEAGRPVITLGKAIYDIPGMTHQAGLDSFWTSAQPPDPGLFDAFRKVVIRRTQIGGAYAIRRGVDLVVPEVVRRLLAR